MGLALRGVELPPVSHELAEDPAIAVFYEFLAAAVCHSTNWDQLRSQLLSIARSPKGFSAARLARLSYEEFDSEFSSAFSGADLPRRHQMFVSVAMAFSSGTLPFDGKSIAQKEWVLSGAEGLYSDIDKLEPFGADPKRKKTRILIQQLFRYDLLHVADPQNVDPAIEYHLIRLYLRTGRVAHSGGMRPSSDALRTSSVHNVNALREAVEEAMRYTADAAELTVGEINEIEWQIGRSYCDRGRPRCQGPHKDNKPVATAISRIASGACPFSDRCDGPHSEKIAQISEPRLADKHGYY